MVLRNARATSELFFQSADWEKEMSRMFRIALAAAAFACAPMSAALAIDQGDTGRFGNGRLETGHHVHHHGHHHDYVDRGSWRAFAPRDPSADYYACYPGNYQYGAPWHE